MKKAMLFSIALLSSNLGAKALSFIDTDFSSFVNHVVAGADRDRFAAYHEKLNKKLDKQALEMQQKVRASMYKNGLNWLSVEHHVWAEEIKLFLSDMQFFDSSFDTERSQARDFLCWYGLYGEFQQRVKGVAGPHQTGDLYGRFKQRITKAAHTVGDWFRSVRQSTIARFSTT